MLGGLGGASRRRRFLPTADINVTSLVDVAFVLLIIFMITAPMMQGGVAIELRSWMIVEIVDRKVRRMDVYASRDEALAAAEEK